MTKRIEVTMTDGSVWAVPAQPVAESRARYYAEVDAGAKNVPEFDGFYADELETGLAEPDELIDWAHNNMNWSDVAALATKLKGPPPPDFQESWVNGEMRVVDEP